MTKNLPEISKPYEELRPQIKTGDFGLCHGTQFNSEIIEFLTGEDSHVFIFAWIGDGLWAAEEWEGVGFQLIPASLKIAYYQNMNPVGIVKVGFAPDVVRNDPKPGLDFISTYRVDTKLHPYGGLPTFLKILESRLGRPIDPMQVQAVCSTFVQQYLEQYKITYSHLLVPSDCEGISTQIIQVDK